eukprot:478774-Prorocentrum_minimum.AAC.2
MMWRVCFLAGLTLDGVGERHRDAGEGHVGKGVADGVADSHEGHALHERAVGFLCDGTHGHTRLGFVFALHRYAGIGKLERRLETAWNMEGHSPRT